MRDLTVSSIIPLGYADHSVEGQGLDASDQAGVVDIATWPVKGMYMPYGLANYVAGGEQYVLTANEGDARDWPGINTTGNTAEETRRAGSVADLTVFPDAAVNTKLGRLNVTPLAPTCFIDGGASPTGQGVGVSDPDDELQTAGWFDGGHRPPAMVLVTRGPGDVASNGAARAQARLAPHRAQWVNWAGDPGAGDDARQGGAVLLRLTRAYLAPYRRLLLLVLVLQSVQALASLFLPNLNSEIIDNGVLTGDTAYIWRVGGVMLLVTGVQLTAALVAVYYASRTAMSFGRDVRGALFHRVTAFSAREVNTYGAPSLINRVTNDVQQVQLLVLMTCTLALAAPVTAVGGVVMAMRQDVDLAWLLLVSIPVLLVTVGTVMSRMIPRFQLMQTRIDTINRVLREQITGIRVVRAFVREPEERARFAGVNRDLTAVSLSAGRLMALMFPLVMLIINASSVALLWVGGHEIESGGATLGALVAFLTYFVLILMSVMMATFVGVMAPRASVSAHRIQEVLDTETSVAPPADPVGRMPNPGTVELRDVAFAYPRAAAPVLSGVSVTTYPGETTAIIGSTGAGKTTLLNLVARLMDVTAGQVLVGGVDVRALDPGRLTDSVGLVPQKPYLFSGTVRTNLQYGKADATDDELWEALRVAQADDFVRAMPGGLDAAIEQGGTNVSGGQRQRLAIARALVRKPDVYLFDDSFSALDLATDARLRAALAPHVRDAAVLVVAQRVATIRHATRIVVLDDGRVVGLGTHDELLHTCPTYEEIVLSQLTAEEAA